MAIYLAGYLRKEGNNVILQLSNIDYELKDYQEHMKNMNIGGLLYINSDKDIVIMDADNVNIQTVNINEIIHNG